MQSPIQIPNEYGGFTQVYLDLSTFWASIDPISPAAYQLGKQVELLGDVGGTGTHTILVRRVAVENLGKSFSKAFSTDFDSMPDLNVIKSNWYLFFPQNGSASGRRFVIKRMEDVAERQEYLRLLVEEVEEEGTGHAVG